MRLIPGRAGSTVNQSINANEQRRLFSRYSTVREYIMEYVSTFHYLQRVSEPVLVSPCGQGQGEPRLETA